MSGSSQPRGLRLDSTIAVLIPHFRCEEWLTGCLQSLVAQTRPAQAIIVIDDASPVPPTDWVRQFPSVTLLQSAENVGPYRLIQQVINDTAFDGYLFQDADDWSGSKRLELLLAECDRSGAELVGCQEMRLFGDGIDAEAHRFPVDARKLILSGAVGYPVLHPASLVSRSLVMRLGGYATGLRLSGDSEFQRRAIHCAHVTNIPEIAYFRRARPDSLTSSAQTGRGSVERAAIEGALTKRWKEARSDFAAGAPVDLSPIAVAEPVELRHVVGPMLSAAGSVSHASSVPSIRVKTSKRRSSGTAPRPPVFVTGAPGSGLGLLYAALADHPNLVPVPGAVWLTRRMQEVVQLFRGAQLDFADAEKLVSRNVREVMPPFQPAWRTESMRTIERQKNVDSRSEFSNASVRLSQPRLSGRWLDASPLYAFHIEQLLAVFPGARFVHVLREPDEVVESIAARGPLQTGTMTPAEAYAAWTRHVEACKAAEESFGPTVIRRLYHHELSTSPESSIRRVLEFIDEHFAPGCVTPIPFFGSGETISHHALEPGVPTDGFLRDCQVAARVLWETQRFFEKPSLSARSSSARSSS